MSEYSTDVDIANRALQHLGGDRIVSFSDESDNASETGFAYDKVRRAELEQNLWRFATKRVVLRPIGISTLLWTPDAFSAGTSYSIGAVVSYGGELWQIDKATNDTTVPNAAAATWWHRYFGPRAVDVYVSGTKYYSGEIVVVPPAWSGVITYAINSIVRSGSTFYVALTGSNLNNDPTTDTTNWTTFSTTNSAIPTTIPLVYPSSTAFYVSLISSNPDNPVAATGTWLNVGGSALPLRPIYPLGTGPVTNLASLNVYRLPHGFLRPAPADPKSNTHSFLGAPSDPLPEDYVYESQYLVSALFGPILLRFVANTTDVYDFHAMFCEMVAARVATEVAPVLLKTAEPEVRAAYLRGAAEHYASEASKARRANAIIVGAISQPRSPFLTCRI